MIWTAVQQLEARIVALKTEHQQGIPALHRMREQLMKFRIMQTNALGGILYGFGIVLPAGYPAPTRAWAGALAEASERLPEVLVVSLREQWHVFNPWIEMAVIERRLTDALRRTEQCKRLIEIPGVGLFTATAAVATSATRPLSNPAVNSHRGSGWYRDRLEQADAFDNMG